MSFSSGKRAARHRAMRRGKGFPTVERYTDLAALRLPAHGTAPLERVRNLTSYEMFDKEGAVPAPAKKCRRG